MLVVFIGLSLVARCQHRTAMQKVTTKSPHAFPKSDQESRRKCMMCGGTGRVASFRRFGTPNSSGSEVCRSCNGAGWIDNPLYGR
jgi:DnaJ-class molecular chaperone